MEFFGVLFGATLFTVLIAGWVYISRHYRLGKKVFITGIVLLFIPAVLISAGFGWYLFIEEPRILALIDAAEEGDVAELQQLLSDGANPSGEFEGETPLKAAERGNHNDVVRLLKKAGAVK